jgi:hypothetical protein
MRSSGQLCMLSAVLPGSPLCRFRHIFSNDEIGCFETWREQSGSYGFTLHVTTCTLGGAFVLELGACLVYWGIEYRDKRTTRTEPLNMRIRGWGAVVSGTSAVFTKGFQ